MIRVLLIDNHVLVRDGLRRLLEDGQEVRVAGAVEDCREAAALLARRVADVALFAVNAPDIGIVDGIARLQRHFPALKLILITEHVNFIMPHGWAKRAVSGFLSKQVSLEELIQAIRQVASGKRYVSQDTAHHWAMRRLNGHGPAPFGDLSHREMQVLLLVSQGKSVGEISTRLCLSPKTVHTYRQRLRGKLGVRSEVEMVRLAHHHGMIVDA
ncbi:MAG: hypothetical protein B7Z66_10880 [Chromatiales bacterium 21-64-14]|nr:MAG: hypothetical protein B7Z66_10880 [Chromatiales bacterium 21-64-14]HQU15609.1 LuxR C-terminal-related transcriptional regulator [Gammaproteobacteria bacterium]